MPGELPPLTKSISLSYPTWQRLAYFKKANRYKKFDEAVATLLNIFEKVNK